MESIDEKSAISAGQYIPCGWEREPDIVLKLIDEIWDDKIKFEDEQLEYHTVYNNWKVLELWFQHAKYLGVKCIFLGI